MSTRSRIGIANDDGTISSIYCHFDGYLDGVGQTLVDAYSDPAKVAELIRLGALSSLYDNVAPADGEHHSFNSPAKNVTVAYHRDRGEGYRAPTVSADETEYRALTQKSWGEYSYLYRDGQWLVSEDGHDEFVPVAEAFTRAEAEEEDEAA